MRIKTKRTVTGPLSFFNDPSVQEFPEFTRADRALEVPAILKLLDDN